MKMRKYSDGEVATVAFYGEFTGEYTAEAEKFLHKSLSEELPFISHLKFDLSGVKMLSSQGLTLLLAAKQKIKSGAKLSFVNVTDGVYDFLESEGITEIVDVKKGI